MVTSETVFHYQPACSAAGCGHAAAYKLAAPWSNGTSHELKTYGLACEAHRDSLLARAQSHRRELALAEGETVGAVGLYSLRAGALDSALVRMPDH